MGFKSLLTLLIALCLATSPALASDWVDDDNLNGFYKHEVKKGTGEPPPGYQEPVYRKPKYRTLGGNSQDQSSVFDTGNNGTTSYDSSMADIASPVTVPPVAPSFNNNQKYNQPPKKKGFFGKLGSIGKSIVGIPADAVEGTGALLSSPLFWQSAGAIAGAGANAYMTHQYYKNNPGAYNPYYGGFGNPYYGGFPGYGGMGFGGLGYGGLGYGGLGYGGLGYGGLGYGGLGYGGGYYNPYYGTGFNRFGGFGYNRGFGNPYFGNYGLSPNSRFGLNRSGVNPSAGWRYNLTTPNPYNPNSIPGNSIFRMR